MKRILEIEGFRAYLALWVVLDHVLSAAGYKLAQLPHVLRVIRSGWYAVDVFVIISGFVIFYLLDQKPVRYREFIIARFFRLWPLFIILFAVAIPMSLWSLQNLEHVLVLHDQAQFGAYTIDRIGVSWDHLFVNILLHVPMLHGLVPNQVVPFAPTAFLAPAWSISLEWQFYLLAPLVYKLLSKGLRTGLLLISSCVVLLWGTSGQWPEVASGAFLPMHIEFFYIGGVSYYVYKWRASWSHPFQFLPVGCVAAVLSCVFFSPIEALPYVLWFVFLGMLLDLSVSKKSLASWFAPLFNHPFVLYLGKISYSIYLSHTLVMIICHSFILNLLDELSQAYQAGALAFLTVTATIFISHFLYKYIEHPGMSFGRRFIK